MAVFKDFAENGDLLEVRNVMVDETNLSRYIAEFGLLKTEGYLEGIEAATQQLLKVLYNDGENAMLPKPPSRVNKEGNELFDKNKSFIEYGKGVIEKMKSEKLKH